MATKPLVSICCQTYNHKNYISKALDGFLMQKVNFEYEILLRDDASIDGTAAICEAYAGNYPDKIKLLAYKKNQYRKGVKPFLDNVKRAEGKYIAICEGDDYWIDPYKLQKQVDFLERNKSYSFCGHNVKITYEEDWQYKRTRRFNNYIDNATFEDILDNHFIPTLSLVYRNTCVKNLPFWLESKNIISSDIPLTLMLASHGKLKYFKEEMGVKRVNGGGMTADKTRLKKNMIFRYELYKNINIYTNYNYNNILYKKIGKQYLMLIMGYFKKMSFIDAFKITFDYALFNTTFLLRLSSKNH